MRFNVQKTFKFKMSIHITEIRMIKKYNFGKTYWKDIAEEDKYIIEHMLEKGLLWDKGEYVTETRFLYQLVDNLGQKLWRIKT